MKQYTVQAPDGKTITLEGPEGASEADVIAQAQKLYKPAAKSATPPQFPLKPTEATVGDILSRFGSPNDQPETALEKLKRAFSSEPGVVTGRESTGHAGVDLINSLMEGATPVGAVVGKAVKAIPSDVRAATSLDKIAAVANKVPLETAEMAQKAGEVENATRFGNLPPVLKKFIQAHTNGEPITYEAGRNLVKNVTDSAKSLKVAGKDNISRLMYEFGDAVKNANRGAAAKVGLGEAYDAAIKEYRLAKTVEERGKVLAKWALGIAASGGAVGSAVALWKKLAP